VSKKTRITRVSDGKTADVWLISTTPNYIVVEYEVPRPMSDDELLGLTPCTGIAVRRQAIPRIEVTLP
jgi:hypothetical protein